MKAFKRIAWMLTCSFFGLCVFVGILIGIPRWVLTGKDPFEWAYFDKLLDLEARMFKEPL